MTTAAGWTAESIQTIIDSLKHKPGALLPILHAIQEELGYIPDKVVGQIAESLLSTRAEVHGVISFYHHFRTSPPGKHIIELCRAEACQAMGCRQLEAHAKTVLGVDYHQATPDRLFSLEPVYCLGNCSVGPNIRVGDEVIARVSPERFDELMASYRQSLKEVG